MIYNKENKSQQACHTSMSSQIETPLSSHKYFSGSKLSLSMASSFSLLTDTLNFPSSSMLFILAKPPPCCLHTLRLSLSNQRCKILAPFGLSSMAWFLFKCVYFCFLIPIFVRIDFESQTSFFFLFGRFWGISMASKESASNNPGLHTSPDEETIGFFLQQTVSSSVTSIIRN